MRDGTWTDVPFAALASVNLSTAAVRRSRTIGQCIVDLRDGRRIVISNVAASGLADGERDDAYRAFVRDFHKALIDSGAAPAIRFHSGFTQARMSGLGIALVIGALFFVVLPVVLLIATGDLESLSLLLGGVFLILPAYRTARTNQPADYQPGAPPDLLP